MSNLELAGGQPRNSRRQPVVGMQIPVGLEPLRCPANLALRTSQRVHPLAMRSSQRGLDPFARKWCLAQPHTRGIENGVCDCGRGWPSRGLAGT
jgi:hypothetical protein